MWTPSYWTDSYWSTYWEPEEEEVIIPPVAPIIGLVPVRYVSDIPNVVPVETVELVDYKIGDVFVNEQVGPANVVPVREAPTETPRVRVIKVVP